MYAGKTVDLRDKISAVVKGLHEHGLKCAVVLPSAITGKEIEVGGVQKTLSNMHLNSSPTVRARF